MGMTTKRRFARRALLAALAVAATSTPALAQFFPFWGQQQQQQPYYQDRPREAPPADYSKAPSAKKPEVPPTSTVVVMGDSMADWLAYGLEEAFADTPEIGVVRKNKPYSGLIRYESKGDLEWSSVARDIINSEKPTVAVMMLGLSDRGPIRDRPNAKAPPAPAPAQQPETPSAQPSPDPQNPESQVAAPEPPKGRGSSSEYRSEVWAEIYSKRIGETIAAMKGRGVLVIWVGLPIIRGPKATSDAAYLNDLYRAQAEKAGAIYVDVWDGFIDESGKFASFGPDVDGQTRRLRAQDGVYFTKYGARKLAHYVEREIRRVMSNRALPVALPMDSGTQPVPRSTGPVARPVAGAVVPLTSGAVPASEELAGAGSARPAGSDPTAARVLVRGEPVAPLKGRADDFVWSQGNTAALPAANMTQEPGTITPTEVPAAAPASAQPDQKPKAEAPPQQQRRPRQAASQAQRDPGAAQSWRDREVPRPPAPVEQRSRSPFSSPFGFLFR
jgi:uncharacterized protein